MASFSIFPLFFSVTLILCLSLCSATHPLDAEEILATVSIPEDDGTGGSTMDELIFGAGTQEGAQVAAFLRGDVVVEGDMVMRPRDFLSSYGGKAGFGGAGLKDEGKLWPKGIIAWDMSDQFKKDQRGVNSVYSAMKEWMEKTCIVFTPKGSAKQKEAGHNGGINIFVGQGCFSSVGKTGNRVSLGKGCKNHGVALHELGHVIGLHHEQARVDRDKTLKILRKNAYSQKGVQINFDIQTDTDPRGIAYDYCSIMHYGPHAFSTNTKFTILTRDQDYQFTIGNPTGKKRMTFEDAKIVNLLYKCNSGCKGQAQCKNPCYVNHKCECECPPKDHCPKKPCKDYSTETATQRTCSWAKKYNLCRGRTDMAKNCAESCGHCDYAKKELGGLIIGGGGGGGGGGDIAPTYNPNAKEGPKCKDGAFCKMVASQIVAGDCVDSNANLAATCPKKCGLCLPCGDRKKECQELAAQGKCDSDKIFMYSNCNRSCKLCVV